MPIELSAHELELLKIALPYAQERGEVPTQEDLRTKLGCRSVNAKHIQNYLIESNAVKVAERVEALPVRAEDKATVQHSLGNEQFGTAYSSVLRENRNLRAALHKAKLKTEADKEQRAQEIRAEIEELKALAKEEIKRKIPTVKPKALVKDSGIMIEIAMPDLHVSKLAHSAETGRRPYDTKIAIAVFERALDALIERTKGFPVEEFLFVVGNDLFQADNERSTTTSGTVVSTDGRFFKTFRKTREMMVRAVERLSKIAKVRVQICPGNHDSQTSFHLGDSLECFFSGDPQVNIVNSPAPRTYVEWGKVLLAFCHGHEGKHSDYALLMASEQPEAWGRTKWREMHVGHLHKLSTEEHHGTRVRVLSALTEADDWHARMGYIGAIRQAEALVWSKKEGLIAEVFFNDDAQEPIITSTEIVNGK